MRRAALVVVLVGVLSAVAAAQSVPRDPPEVQDFIGKVAQLYFARNGVDYEFSASRHPHTAALMIGHALWVQQNYAGQDPALKAALDRLKAGIRTYFATLAARCNYRDLEGAPVDAASLWASAQRGMGPRGEYFARENFRVENGDVPNVLAPGRPPLAPSPSSQGQQGGHLQADNAIQLFGIDAPGSNQHSSGTVAVRATDPSKNRAKADVILGVWEEIDEYNRESPAFRMEVTRDGEFYVGRCVGIDPRVFGKRYNFKIGDVIFKVKIDTWLNNSGKKDDFIPIYTGQGIGLTAYTNGQWTWRDREIRISESRDGARMSFTYWWIERFHAFRKVGR